MQSTCNFHRHKFHVLFINLYIFSIRKPCKIGFRFMEDGTKVRIARGQEASGAIIPRPEILKMRRKPRPTEGTLKIENIC